MCAARSPTLDTLAIILVVFLAQAVTAAVGTGITAILVLAPPLVEPPWSPITSVYAHGSIAHLVGNATSLAILGLIVERGTTRGRFHAFFLTTGVISVFAEGYYQIAMGTPRAVLGASGAVFALLGYVLAGNPLSGGLLNRLDLPTWLQLLVVGAAAGAIALWATPEGAALVGHFTGLVLGLVAGRLRLLRVP
jgi:membrane associated rhomboid family serine protease